MRLQSAIFDMDGTLLDSMFIWNDLGARTLRTLGIEPEANLGEKLKVLTVRQGAAYCKDAYHMTQSVDEIVALIEAQVEDFYTHQVQAKAGVVKFLSLLKMEGVWMYVATATDRHLAEAPCAAPGSTDTSGASSPARRSVRERTAPRSSNGACAACAPTKRTP